MPGVIAGGAKLYCKFTTRDAGVPTTLSGSPAISVYKDDSTTESTAGVTLTVDFDGRTGLNHVTIDTSADTTFYANGHHYELVITAGTVAGNSVVGEVVLPGGFDLSASAGTAGDADVIRTATCPSQAGMTSTEIKLDSGASASDNAYQWDAISIVGGTGAGQSRVITAYVGSTKVCTVDWAWLVQPDSTSIFAITPTTRAEVVGVPDVRLADAVAHGGTLGSSTATLALSHVNITASTGNAITVSATDTGSRAITLAGNYIGLEIQSTDSAGTAMRCTGAQTGASLGDWNGGITVFGGDSVPAVHLQGPYTTAGPVVLIDATTGDSGIDGGPGVLIRTAGTGDAALKLQADTIADTVQVGDGSTTKSVFDNDAAVKVGDILAAALATFFATDSGKVYADAISGSVVKEIATNAGGSGGDVNVTSIGGQTVTAASPITVNANLGTTQPINFQGSGATAWVKSDLETIRGVNSAGDAGYVGIDWNHITNKTAIVDLTNTTIAIVGVVSGSVGSISGVTFPTNFSALKITTGGYTAINWGDVLNPGSTVSLSATTIATVSTVTALGATAKNDVSAAVLDVSRTAHNVSGTIGEAINDSASAGDPLDSIVPDGYVAGTAGYVIGQFLDAAVSSRLSPTVAGRTLDVSVAGNAGVDWANIDSPTATVNLSNTTIAEAQNVTTVLGNVVGDVGGTVGGSSVPVEIDLTIAVPTSNTANTIGDCLNAARADGFGKWVLSGTTLTLYAPNGTTPVKVFTLDSGTAPTQRT